MKSCHLVYLNCGFITYDSKIKVIKKSRPWTITKSISMTFINLLTFKFEVNFK